MKWSTVHVVTEKVWCQRQTRRVSWQVATFCTVSGSLHGHRHLHGQYLQSAAAFCALAESVDCRGANDVHTYNFKARCDIGSLNSCRVGADAECCLGFSAQGLDSQPPEQGSPTLGRLRAEMSTRVRHRVAMLWLSLPDIINTDSWTATLLHPATPSPD